MVARLEELLLLLLLLLLLQCRRKRVVQMKGNNELESRLARFRVQSQPSFAALGAPDGCLSAGLDPTLARPSLSLSQSQPASFVSGHPGSRSCKRRASRSGLFDHRQA
jgi:hypothetical protein